MAGIDKTFTNNYEEYKELLDWVEGKNITFTYNNRTQVIRFTDFIYKWHKDEFDGDDKLIMNTPTWFDSYLYKNCPVKFVKERLEEVYSDTEYLNSLKINTLPENFKKNRKIKVLEIPGKTYFGVYNKPLGNKKWWVQNKEVNLWYNEELRAWVPNDTFPWQTNTMFVGSIKSLVRLLRNMYLPECEFEVSGGYIGEQYLVKVK